MDPEILASIIGPLLTAMLAGSAVVLRHWQARRTRRDEAEESLERRREQITFIDTWLTAHQKVAGQDAQARAHTQRAVDDLEFLYRQMTTELHHPPARPRRFTALDLLRVVALVPVVGVGAQLLRVGYYLTALGGILFIIATMATLEPSGKGLAFDIGVAMVVTLLWCAPAIVFAIATKAVDRATRNARARRAGLAEPDPVWTDQPTVGPAPSASWNPTGPTGPPTWSG